MDHCGPRKRREMSDTPGKHTQYACLCRTIPPFVGKPANPVLKGHTNPLPPYGHHLFVGNTTVRQINTEHISSLWQNCLCVPLPNHCHCELTSGFKFGLATCMGAFLELNDSAFGGSSWVSRLRGRAGGGGCDDMKSVD